MNPLIKIFSLTLIFFCNISYAQPSIKIIDTSSKASIRGLSVVNDNTLWVSGNKGSVGKSLNGGKTWKWIVVKGYEKNDFRDIEAFDDTTAIVMGITQPAIILKTKDGGNNWYKVFEDTTKGAFLDAMDFTKIENKWIGRVIGDPINDKMYLLSTNDAGEVWNKLNNEEAANFSSFNKGEAFFAASGTNIQFSKWTNNGPIVAVSGGASSRLWCTFYCKRVSSIPILQGNESSGAFSIAASPTIGKAIIVGGDYKKDTLSNNNCVLVEMKSMYEFEFTKPTTYPHGFRSCVIYIDEKNLVTCGTSGVDISKDGGKNWQLISKQSFNVVQKARNGKAIYFAGDKGKIGKLELGVMN